MARYADACFYVECGGVTILRSMVGFVSLTRALVTATAIRLGTNSRSALLLEEELLSTLGVYAENESDGDGTSGGRRKR